MESVHAPAAQYSAPSPPLRKHENTLMQMPSMAKKIFCNFPKKSRTYNTSNMQLHLIIQPQGGTGKSFSAVHLAQYLGEVSTVQAFDLDTQFNTLSKFKGIGATAVDIPDADNIILIDALKFDLLLKKISQSDKNHVIVDFSSNNADEFLNYTDELKFFDILSEFGIERAIIHIPICGGQNFIDNLRSLKNIYDFIAGRANYVIWENPFFGEVAKDGITLENCKIHKAMSNHILGIVKIPKWDSTLKKDDVHNMMAKKLTYAEVAESADFKIFSRSRLKSIKEDFFRRIGTIDFSVSIKELS